MTDSFEVTPASEFADARVLLTIDDRVARIVLNNPPLNMLSMEMLVGIADAVNEASRHEALCAIVFEPGPKCRAFSAGLAMDELRAEVAYQMLESFHQIFKNLDFHSKPTIAIVQDAALGAGCELAAFCDIVIASEKSRFGLPEIKIGVFPPRACVYFPRIVGYTRAREMVLTGTLLTAREAQDAGLVTHVVPDDQIQAKTTEVLDRLRGLSAAVLETARRALVQAAGVPVEDGLARVEDLYLNHLMNLKDPGEGLVAFLEKRTPVWKHR
jgi:cyclohexa-1,5-dienecarbonyl-CoA hydratase